MPLADKNIVSNKDDFKDLPWGGLVVMRKIPHYNGKVSEKNIYF